MIRHLGPTCRLCGCPLRPGDELASGICDPCYDWQQQTSVARQAATYAGRLEHVEQQQRWEQIRRERARVKR